MVEASEKGPHLLGGDAIEARDLPLLQSVEELAEHRTHDAHHAPPTVPTEEVEIGGDGCIEQRRAWLADRWQPPNVVCILVQKLPQGSSDLHVTFPPRDAALVKVRSH